MSIRKNNKKSIQKRKVREKAVRKKVVENRLEIRKQKKMEELRANAFEEQFKQKENLGLSPSNVRENIEYNMKMLETLNANSEAEKVLKQEAIQRAKEQLELAKQIEEKTSASEAQEENNSEKNPGIME